MKVFIFRSMNPFIVGEVSLEIKKLVKSLAEYEFEMELSDEYIEEQKVKTISLKRIIWRELGKEAFNQWFNYFHCKADSNNTLMLGIMMYKQLLENAYNCIKEVEYEEEKKRPRQTRSLVGQKRTVNRILTIATRRQNHKTKTQSKT